MAKKLTDLSQLTKAILKESPPPCPVEKPAPEPPQSREDADAAAVLAYFSRPSQNAPQRNRAAPCAVPAKDQSPRKPRWKLQYANVRVTMSKTPSDYRANLNNGNEIANRCF